MTCKSEDLRQIPLFALLDDDEMAVLAAQVEIKKFAARQRIYKLGEPGKHAYVMISGVVRVTTVDEDHQEVLVDEPSRGDFFGFASMLEDTPHQTTEAETLRSAFAKLQQKLQETQATCEMLVAQHHRARVVGKANTARAIAGAQHKSSTLNRLRSSILQQEATNTAAHSILEDDTLEDRFAAIDREERVERLLEDLKSRQPRLA